MEYINQKRNAKKFQFRANEAEKKRIEKLAKRSHMNMSNYLRTAALGNSIRPVVLKDEEEIKFLNKKIQQQEQNNKSLLEYIDKLIKILGTLETKLTIKEIRKISDLILRTPSNYDNALETFKHLKNKHLKS